MCEGLRGLPVEDFALVPSEHPMDRDFLFGVIAVQLGQATPQQVMVAAAAYFTDRSKTIPERLVADGVLSDERRLLLESMAGEAVKAHGGDVRKTVQALGGDRAVYASFGGSLAMDELGRVSLVSNVESTGDTTSDLDAVTSEAEGRYRIAADAEIGRGGIGRILVAFDTHLGREVAVKELLTTETGSAQGTPASDALRTSSALSARFLREARVTGQLEHPSIVPVHEVGERSDGTYYYTMKLVRGRTLSEVLGRCETLAARLKLLPHYVDLCHAVAYAHSRGVIHRDIKPENVMVGEFGETVVLDWGLAKVKGTADHRDREIQREVALLLDAHTGKTVDGAAIGTPAYMSPEQADGAVSEIDERSDVWSLGAVLYEILTGRPPFDGVTPYEIMGKVLREDVRPPRELNGAIRPELAAVAEKALSRDKPKRYESATKLAADVEAYMTGAWISAYEYTSWELLAGFVKRNKGATASVLVIFLLVAMSAVGLFRAYRDANAERDRAERNEVLARQNERTAHFNLAVGLNEKARRNLEAADFLGARIFAAASLVNNPVNPRSPHYRADDPFHHSRAQEVFVDAYSSHQQAGVDLLVRPRAILKHGGPVNAVAFSHDGKVCASGGAQKRIVLWDAATARMMRTLDALPSPVTSLAFTPDGRLLVSGHESGVVALWSTDGYELRERFDWHTQPVSGIAVDGESRHLVTTSKRGRVVVWDLEARRLDEVLSRTGDAAYAAFRPSTPLVAVRDPERLDRTTFWDTSTRTTRGSLPTGRDSTVDVHISAEGRWLAACTVDGKVDLWDLHAEARITTFEGHTEQLEAVLFVPGGKYLVSAGNDQTLRLWNLETRTAAQVVQGHQNAIVDLAISPDGATIASASRDGTARLWAIKEPTGDDRITARGRVWFLEYSPDGTKLAASGSSPGIWEASSRKLSRDLGGIASVGVAFSPDGKLLALGGRDKLVHVWNLATGEKRTLKGELPTYVRHLAFSPDGHVLASGSWGGVSVFDVASGEVRFTVDGTGGVSFSPDGKTLATGSNDKCVKLWDASSGKLVKALQTQPDRIDDVTYSHDGRWLAATWFDGTLLLWDTAHLETPYALKGHGRWINSVAFDSNDELLCSASDDWSVRVWSVKTRKTVMVLRSHNSISSATFTPDGKAIAVESERSVLLYPIVFNARDGDPQDLLETAEREAGMRLEGFSLVPDGAVPAP